jgi:hypothetical protein
MTSPHCAGGRAASEAAVAAGGSWPAPTSPPQADRALGPQAGERPPARHDNKAHSWQREACAGQGNARGRGIAKEAPKSELRSFDARRVSLRFAAGKKGGARLIIGRRTSPGRGRQTRMGAEVRASNETAAAGSAGDAAIA